VLTIAKSVILTENISGESCVVAGGVGVIAKGVILEDVRSGER